MAKRRARRVASAVARAARRGASAGVAIVRAAPRRIARRVAAPVIRIREDYRRASGSRRRRAAVAGGLALGRGASVVAIAQARILPAAAGGYIVAKLERSQRVKAAQQVDTKQGSGALIKDPTTRILVGMGLAALGASRTQGMAREAFCGAAGGLAAIYESYNNHDASNPLDNYAGEIKAGGDGISGSVLTTPPAA